MFFKVVFPFKNHEPMMFNDTIRRGRGQVFEVDVKVEVSGIFVPKTIRSLEHSFPWWNFRSRDHSFLGTFVSWTVRSMELSFPGTLVPGTLDLSCRGPFVHLSAEQYLVWNSVTNRGLWRRRCTAAIAYTNSQECGNDFLIGRAGSSPTLLLLVLSSLPFPLHLPSPFPPSLPWIIFQIRF